MKRTKDDAARTRKDILAAALSVFTNKGFERTTLDDIARSAGTTRGAIYHHFKNKAEVYHTLLLESGRKSSDVIPLAIAEGGTFLEIIQRIFSRQLLQLDQDPTLRSEAIFTLRGDYASVESVRIVIEAQSAAVIAQLTQAFAEAQAGGEVRTDIAPLDIARAFNALQAGLIHVTRLPGQEKAISESTLAVTRIFAAGIAVRK